LFKHDAPNAYEAIDSAITIDLPSYGIIPKLYQAARSKSEKPLCHRAASVLVDCVRNQRDIIIVTGFPVPSPFSPKEKPAVHSDGPMGVAFLSKALVQDLNLKVTLLTDEGVGKVLHRCIQASSGADMADRIPVVEFQTNRDITNECRRILSSKNPGIVIVSEKPGRNKVGEYHTATGKNLTSYISYCDSILDFAKEVGMPTVAVGDLGNDAGMGNIADEIVKLIPSENVCSCPCKSGIISTVACDNLVVGTMCDWGIYGILACVAIDLKNPTIVPEAKEVKRVMSSFASFSGVSFNELLTDGISPEYATSCLETLRGIVQSQM
jgi:D-glutamate cyclase